MFPLLLLSSCDRVLETLLNNDDDKWENYRSPWQGTWVGTYSGMRSGEIIVKINKKGYADVTLSGGVNSNFLYGMVTHSVGAFQSFANSSSDDFFIYGNLIQQSGTWKWGSATGQWTLTKQ